MRLGICGRLRPGLRGRGEPLPSGPAGRLPIFARWRGRVGIGGPLPRAGVGGFAAAAVRPSARLPLLPADAGGWEPVVSARWACGRLRRHSRGRAVPGPPDGGASPPGPPDPIFRPRKIGEKARQGGIPLGNPPGLPPSSYGKGLAPLAPIRQGQGLIMHGSAYPGGIHRESFPAVGLD